MVIPEIKVLGTQQAESSVGLSYPASFQSRKASAAWLGAGKGLSCGRLLLGEEVCLPPTARLPENFTFLAANKKSFPAFFPFLFAE